MTSMLSRLFTYRELPTLSPLENFLTEAFAALFQRLPADLKRSLVAKIIPPTALMAFDVACPDIDHLQISTQVVIPYSYRPDVVFSVDDRPLIAVEIKVGAGLQEHTLKTGVAGEVETSRNQLESYAEWIREENAKRHDAWRGSVALLTAHTNAPPDFVDGRPDGIARSTWSWKEFGDWIVENVDMDQSARTHCALAADIYLFLEEQKLMSRHFTARDLAAATLYVSSSPTLPKSFKEAILAVAKHVPKLSAGRQVHTDFWADINGFAGWFYFARALRRRPARPALSVGVCFEIGTYWSADQKKLPRHEPFFFVDCSDEQGKWTARQILTGIPDGWIEAKEGKHALCVRPVREFPDDPDERIVALKSWATKAVDQLTAYVPGYDDAPAGALAADDEAAED